MRSSLMMTRARGVLAVASCCTAMGAYAAPCRATLLPADVLRLVRPLIELRIQQSRDQFTEDGHWKGESPLTPEVDRQFEALLRNHSRTGNKALAYLLTVYMGEHHGEELVCEVVSRGEQMVSLVRSYQECRPLTGLEPLPRFVQGSGALPRMALEALASGRPCVYEE